MRTVQRSELVQVSIVPAIGEESRIVHLVPLQETIVSRSGQLRMLAIAILRCAQYINTCDKQRISLLTEGLEAVEFVEKRAHERGEFSCMMPGPEDLFHLRSI